MVFALVEEDGLLPKHPLLAGGECGLEEMGFRDEDQPGCLGARDHHARAPQHVRLEYRAVPADSGINGTKLVMELLLFFFD